MRFQAFLMALLAASCTTVVQRPLTHPAPNAAWQVLTERGSGSGFPVKCIQVAEEEFEITFVTAGHVVDGVSSVAVKHGDRLIRDATTTSHDFLDAALLVFIDTAPVETLPLRRSKLRLGETAWVAGYGGRRLWLSVGIVSARDRTTANIFPGDSGAPVLDGQGRVIGIALGVYMYRVRWSVSPILPNHHCRIAPIYDLLDWIG